MDEIDEKTKITITWRCSLCGLDMVRWRSQWQVWPGSVDPSFTCWVWTCPNLSCHTMFLEKR